MYERLTQFVGDYWSVFALVGFIVLWFALQLWILPRLGVST